MSSAGYGDMIPERRRTSCSRTERGPVNPRHRLQLKGLRSMSAFLFASTLPSCNLPLPCATRLVQQRSSPDSGVLEGEPLAVGGLGERLDGLTQTEGEELHPGLPGVNARLGLLGGALSSRMSGNVRVPF